MFLRHDSRYLSFPGAPGAKRYAGPGGGIIGVGYEGVPTEGVWGSGRGHPGSIRWVQKYETSQPLNFRNSVDTTLPAAKNLLALSSRYYALFPPSIPLP